MNQEVPMMFTNNGDESKAETERVKINQDVQHSIIENDDINETEPISEHEEVNHDVQKSTKINKDDPKESKPESQHVNNNLASSTRVFDLDKEGYPEQPEFANAEEPGLSPEEKHSSLELRRLPVDVLLQPGSSPDSSVAGSDLEEEELETPETPRGFLRTTCLNPKFGLRTQLLLAFGSVSAFIIAFVLIISVFIAWNSGENLKSINQGSFEDLVSSIEGNLARYLAESLTPTLIPEDVVRILSESVKDRFAGYPIDGDEFVPFFDIDSQSNKYPVIGVTGRPLPLDWQIEANVNDNNHEEHVQGRWSWYATEPAISTANAGYIMQGMCDPAVTDPSAMTYWENCTEANNDVSTGGVVTPSPTNSQIYRKASSLGPILKAVFESQQEIREIGIFFSNGGAGAGLNFPHYQLSTNASYISTGCEWMNAPNPYDPSRPIGTKEEIARCRPEGTTVSSRIYNNLERGWCRNQALNPFEYIVDGPYLDAWKENQLLISVGQGIYDRITNNFIACMYVGWYLDNMEEILGESKVTENSEVSVTRFDDGTTVASTAWDSSTANDTVKTFDLPVGLTFEAYEELKILVDYNTTWDPTEVRQTYEAFALRHEGFMVTAYPMPPVPDSYNPSYKPLFFVLLSASEEDIFQVVKDVKKNVDEHVTQVMLISLIVGAIGLTIVLMIIYLMSSTLTSPLVYMSSAADDVINHFGTTKSSCSMTKSVAPSPGCRCSPRTELDDVVKEFDRMMTSFSGSFATAAKAVKGGREEILNGFNMQKDFDELYESRQEARFTYKVGSYGNGAADIAEFINLGRNSSDEDTLSRTQNSVVRRRKKDKGAFTSRLFFWTVLLVGTPLLLTTIGISAIVMYNMSKEFQSSIEASEAFYLDVELNALSVYTSLRAGVVSSGTSKPTRDLFLLTRYASWLLFGGVERAESFTLVKSGVEDCKTFSDIKECPFSKENNRCDCAWNEPGLTCNNYTFDTRHLQELYFACQATDALPNGDRNFTSFPNVSYSPESTVWWDDIRTLPGSEKGALASGFETTYDRLRVISASPLHQVVYNKDVGKEYTIGNDIGFEADGLFLVFTGCDNYRLPILSKWSSTEANGASTLRPELCPIGKYGYDPRCRGWYDTGKKLAEADGTSLHVTPPYVFADSSIGQSATSPLIDPQTNEHVGQVLVDFLSGPTLASLDDKNILLRDEGFTVLITTLPGADSVISPGFSLLNESARPISELVLPDDHNCLEADCELHIGQFEELVSAMKNGESGSTNFTRRSSSGSTETVYVAYAPVALKEYRPLDASDFSRGVQSGEVLIYSLALAQTEAGLLEPFEQIEEETNKKIRVSIAVLSVIILFSILFAIYIMSIVTLSLTDPMLVLLDVIHSINRLNVNEEPPMVDHSIGSKELNSVSETVQTLYKVVRCGNYAFFSGDLERAYAVLYDASRLFCHLDNKKAIGVVSNNLGNLLLVAVRAMDAEGADRFCGMTKGEIITKGISFYHDAIQLGEKAYDEFHDIEGWSPNCLDFMQHLSNRYFNRGMFLLTVKEGHTQPDEIERLGNRDLEIARDMDMEIVESGLQAGWGHVTSVLKKFDVALVRAKGHITSQELGYPDDWEVGDMLDDAFMMVKKEVEKDHHSSLFKTVTAVGRLQEIETELIRYKLLQGEVRLAGQIAIRMLVEDEYTFPEAQEKALEALSAYIESMNLTDDKRAELNLKLATCKKTLIAVIDDMDKSRMSVPTEYEEGLADIAAVKRAVGGSDYTNSTTRRSTIRFSQGFLTMEDF